MLDKIPCPCDSGKMMIDCCLPIPLGDLEDHVQNTIDAANQKGDENFVGLSPKDLHSLLYDPLESPHLMALNEPFPEMCQAPAMRIMLLLAEAIGENGLKATAKGYLPRNLCREIVGKAYDDGAWKKRANIIRTEVEAGDLHYLRLVAEMAGLLNLRKGKWFLTAKCRKFLAKNKPEALYRPLFEAYVQKYNWVYATRLPDLGFVQQSFAFSLHLAHHFGETWRDCSFYSKRFLVAFPQILEEMPEIFQRDPRHYFDGFYGTLVFARFLKFFGLAETRGTGFEETLQVKNSDLLKRFVTWV